MTTDYPSGYRRTPQQEAYEEWLNEKAREAKRRGLEFSVHRGTVEFIDKLGYAVERFDYDPR